METVVTVVIDTFNHERFIEEAIRSVLSQDFPQSQMEILVVDDGSTDRTAEIVRQFEPQIKLLRKANGGQASAISFGVAHARGEFVAFLDGDDVWLPNKVSRVVAEFERNLRAVLVYHKFSFWDSRDGREWNPKWPLVSGDILADRHKMQLYSPAPTSSLAFRKTCLDRLTPVPQRCSYMHDAYLTGTAIFLGPVSALPESLTKNRVHGNNLWYTVAGCQTREALERRVGIRHAVIESTNGWISKNVPASTLPKAREFVLLAELACEADEFLLHAPGRLRFARHLVRRAWHYGARMTWRHRLVTYMNAFGSLFTGYEHLHLLDEWRVRIKHMLTGRSGAAFPGASVK